MDIEESILKKINSPKELAILIKKNYTVIIKISASWCGPCKNKKFLESYHSLKSNYSDISNIKFVELDIDDDSEIIDSKKYYDIDVDSVPTFIIANNGSFTKKYVGGGYLNDINEYLSKIVNSY
jgi:thiol-disulfide isomerase/thioredoxin